MRLRALLVGWLVALEALASSSTASAQFNPAGRKKKPPAAAGKPTRPAPPRSGPAPKAEPRSEPQRESAPVPRAEGRKDPSDDALIARYTQIALSQPGVDFPVQRLA